MKYVPGGDNLVKGVQGYELFGGIARKNHAFFYMFFIVNIMNKKTEFVADLRFITQIFLILLFKFSFLFFFHA